MKYVPALDGLRGIAVWLVVLHHAYPDWAPGGWIGVEIFFVLSGYLITTILADELKSTATISFTAFYARRALRLMPAAACLFLFLTVRAIHSPHRSEIIQSIVVSALYFMNWSRAFELFPQDVLPHMWSLSMEEQFYLVWPAAIAFVFDRRPRVWIATGVVVVVLWRCWLAAHGAGAERTYNGFDTHSDGLLIGCILAFLSDQVRAALAGFAWLALPLLIASVILVPYDAPGVQAIGLTVFALLSATLISAGLERNLVSKVLSLPPLVFTGRISYSWYLWHFPLIMLTLYHLDKSSALAKLAMPAAVAISYVVAALSYFVVERPFLMLKTRFSFAKMEQARRTTVTVRDVA